MEADRLGAWEMFASLENYVNRSQSWVTFSFSREWSEPSQDRYSKFRRRGDSLKKCFHKQSRTKKLRTKNLNNMSNYFSHFFRDQKTFFSFLQLFAQIGDRKIKSKKEKQFFFFFVTVGIFSSARRRGTIKVLKSFNCQSLKLFYRQRRNELSK